MVETNIIIKVPYLDFGEFLRFIGIWLLIIENPGTNWANYFRKKTIDIFSECSIFVNQFMSGNNFESICSSIKFNIPPPPSLPTFKIKCMNYDI